MQQHASLVASCHFPPISGVDNGEVLAGRRHLPDVRLRRVGGQLLYCDEDVSLQPTGVAAEGPPAAAQAGV